MKIYRTIQRYYLIIKKINESNFPTFDKIRECLSDNHFPISPRTLQRDIENIRWDFHIEIKYDMARKGYYIDMEESGDFDDYMRFFEMSMISGSLTEAIKDSKNLKRFISFDKSDDLLGIEYFNKILFAIQNHDVIKILYQRFNDDSEPYEEKIAPILLKEYQKRWYVVAKLLRKNEIRTYGLDRIKGYQLTDEKYLEADVEIIKEKFENIIGIGFYDNEPEIVELSFTPEQGKYVKTLKWHHTQKEIEGEEDEYRIQLFVGRNFELEQKIMNVGDQVKVIRPEWLKDIIIKRYKNFIKNNS